MPGTGYQHMVHDYYVKRLRSTHAERRATLRALRTHAQARQYQEEVRRAIARAFAPRPRKTSLNARCSGTIERRFFRIEKILFESRPGFTVSAHLYLPRGEGPFPAVLGTCGHDAAGIQAPIYQSFCQRLARAGFAALIYDPINQGERDQYWHLENRNAVAPCTHAHNMMGKQLELVGDFFGMWRVWDGMRALDYFLARPEVDTTRVGLTGNSGGGTISTWLWALDERITMAAPSCFVTTFLHNLENELPADSEQYPPGVIGSGLDMADFIIARAPSPTLLLGQRYDFFDRRGLQQAFDDVAQFYDLIGAPTANRDLFIGPQGHGFSRHNQEAMVEFFARHAATGNPPCVSKITTLDNTALNTTPDGNTVAAGDKPIYEWIAKRADQLSRTRHSLPTGRLKKRLHTLLSLPRRSSTPHYRVLRPQRHGEYTHARYAIESEGDVRALLHKRLAHATRGHTLDVERTPSLYLPHLDAVSECSSALPDLVPLYGLNPRGLGESRPDDADFFHPYGMDYLFHGHALMLGESYLGRRVHDTLSALDLLVGEGAQKVRLHGRGQGALIALCVALLHDRSDTVTLYNAPISYTAWCKAPLVAWPAANFLRGALRYFDLPDLYRALGKRLRLIEPWGPDMKPLRGKALRLALGEAGLTA